MRKILKFGFIFFIAFLGGRLSYSVFDLKKENREEAITIANEVEEKDVFDNKNSYWKDKTILWLGTSIPEGGYPLIVGENLQANIINNSKGCSTIRTGIASKVNDNDPMGIANIQWEVALNSLTQTVKEKQSIIDNWEMLWGPDGDDEFKLLDAPDKLSKAQVENILGSSYEKLLVPYLDGTYGMPDLFVIDHGWNDGIYSNGTEEMSEFPEDDNDRHYYIGAMNKIIRMILEANPRARIVIIGHYENDRRPWVNRAQEKIADIWGFPLLKLWEKTGWSTMNITVNEEELTMIEVYMPDGLHPHSDVTWETTKLYADIVSEWLNTVR